jgi:hypothetical protein
VHYHGQGGDGKEVRTGTQRQVIVRIPASASIPIARPTIAPRFAALRIAAIRKIISHVNHHEVPERLSAEEAAVATTWHVGSIATLGNRCRRRRGVRSLY